MIYPNAFIERFREVYPHEDGILAMMVAGEETKVGLFLEAAAKMSTNELLDMIFDSRESKETMEETANKVRHRREIYEEWKAYISSETRKK